MIIISICSHPIGLFLNKYICSILVEVSENILKIRREKSLVYRIIKLYIQYLKHISQHKLYVVENIFFPTQKEKEVIDTPMPKKQTPPIKLRDKIIEKTNIHGKPVYTNIKIICVNIIKVTFLSQ
jgi:hypothetical protein